MTNITLNFQCSNAVGQKGHINDNLHDATVIRSSRRLSVGHGIWPFAREMLMRHSVFYDHYTI